MAMREHVEGPFLSFASLLSRKKTSPDDMAVKPVKHFPTDIDYTVCISPSIPSTIVNSLTW